MTREERDLLTLARYYAKKQAKADFAAEGLKTQYLEITVISEAADQLLAERPEEFRLKARNA